MAESKYDKYVVKKPAYEVAPKVEVKGRIPADTKKAKKSRAGNIGSCLCW